MGEGLTNVGYNPQLPHLLVYHQLEHLGLHGMRQPLETSLNAVTFQHSSWLHGEKGDGPGWEPGRPTGGPFVWKTAELVSAHTAHPAVIFYWEVRREERWVFRGTPAAAPAPRPRCFTAERKRQPDSNTGGSVFDTVPPNFESCVWFGFGFGEVR